MGQSTERKIKPKAEILGVCSDVHFGLVERGHRGIRLSDVNEAAKQQGIQAGDALADARSVLPSLTVADAQPIADKIAVRNLAHWCGCYGILRNAYGFKEGSGSSRPIRRYGIWIDISGVAHLYGGERNLLLDLQQRFSAFGITARVAVADTLGAAHALAWYDLDASPSRVIESPEGCVLESIAHLPVAALRLDDTLVQLITRLGFKTIGALASIPRVALERRFRSQEEGQQVLRRLDQALGLRSEPRRALLEPPSLSVQQRYADPLITSETFENEVHLLLIRFCDMLEGASMGVRGVRVVFFRCDGTVGDAVVAFSRATSKLQHMHRLLQQRMCNIELGYGVDLLSIEAVSVEKQVADQGSLIGCHETTLRDLSGQLVDRLVNRLGKTSVTQLCPQASHWPERREVRVEALILSENPKAEARGFDANVSAQRPILLLQNPERISVTAEIPEGAPARFTWRRVGYKVIRSAGPERIEPEWWRELRQPQKLQSRDYYTVEDDAGARFWVFRVGRYNEGTETLPGWFIHGVFA